jgi:PAS domain-containing protein
MTAETYDSILEELVALWLGVDRLTLERSYRTKDGEVVDAILNWEVSRKDGLRDLTNVRLVFTEITEQKKAAQALRLSEQRYRLHFEQAPLAVAEFDYTKLRPWFEELRTQGVENLETYLRDHPAATETILTLAPLVDVNQSALALLGAKTKAELVARLREVMTDSTIAVRTANAVRIWQGTTSAAGEFEVRRLDGEKRTLSFHWQMQTDEAGRPTFGRTQTVLADITEPRRRARAASERGTLPRAV